MATKPNAGALAPRRRQPRGITILVGLLVITGGTYLLLPKSWFEIPPDDMPARSPAGQPAAPGGTGNLDTLRSEAAMHPLDFEARSRYGMALASAGSADQALDEFKAAQTVAPENPLVYQNLGGWYLNQRRYAEADRWFCRALEVAPGSGRPHYLRGLALQGMTLQGQRKENEAFRQFRLAVALEPGFADSYLQLAMVATKRAPQSQVLGWIEEYRKLSGNSSLADYVLSGAYKTWHRYDEAARYGESSVKQDPENFAYWHNLGQVYAYARRYDDAEKALAKAQGLTPNPGTVLIERGMNAQAAGRIRDAIDHFQEALKASPETGNIHHYLSRAYQRAGDNDSAGREEAAFRQWERNLREFKSNKTTK